MPMFMTKLNLVPGLYLFCARSLLVRFDFRSEREISKISKAFMYTLFIRSGRAACVFGLAKVCVKHQS